MTEADVLFNEHQQFDSYRGPLRYGNGGYAIGDIRRILLHELGHAIGLDHPDDHGQHVDAIMNSETSNRETLASDDISGAQFFVRGAIADSDSYAGADAAANADFNLSSACRF